jgi:hypothetical protein
MGRHLNLGRVLHKQPSTHSILAVNMHVTQVRNLERTPAPTGPFLLDPHGGSRVPSGEGRNRWRSKVQGDLFQRRWSAHFHQGAANFAIRVRAGRDCAQDVRENRRLRADCSVADVFVLDLLVCAISSLAFDATLKEEIEQACSP